MNRRNFILSLIGAGAAGAVASAIGIEASCAVAKMEPGRVWVSAEEYDILLPAAPMPLRSFGCWTYVFSARLGFEGAFMPFEDFIELADSALCTGRARISMF